MALTIGRKETWVCSFLNTSYGNQLSCEIALRTFCWIHRPSWMSMYKRRQTGGLLQQKIYFGHRTPMRCQEALVR